MLHLCCFFVCLPFQIECVIVKSGDDLRQEQLAMQLIEACHSIFTEADLPLWCVPTAHACKTSNHSLSCLLDVLLIRSSLVIVLLLFAGFGRIELLL